MIPEKYRQFASLWGELLDDEHDSGYIADQTFEKYPDFDSSRETLSRVIRLFKAEYFADKELVVENVRLAKQKQGQQDKNRIERKAFREYARVENSVAEFGRALVEQNKKHAKALKKVNLGKLRPPAKDKVFGALALSDIHANELIDLPHNKYDFKILAKRLKKYISESLAYFEFRGVTDVLFALTGDLLNSDRRLDELLNASTNRAKAAVLTTHLLKQALLEVRAMGLPITVISVLGNESRVNKEMSFSNEAFSDSYDFTIAAQLKQMFEFAEIDGIKWGPIDKVETVVTLGKQKLLVAHNINKQVDNQQKTQAAIGRHAIGGEMIDFVIGGHIHAARQTDLSCRSGSMAGSNSYNENALNLASRASHYCYVFEGMDRFIQYIDLQHTDGIKGYHIVEELEAYNAKSVEKTKQTTAIFKVVI